jgi:hypothetical protein
MQECSFCSNGVGRTGTFTTIFSQVERIKAEQIADIFQYVKGIRLQRADLVLEEVSFSERPMAILQCPRALRKTQSGRRDAFMGSENMKCAPIAQTVVLVVSMVTPKVMHSVEAIRPQQPSLYSLPLSHLEMSLVIPDMPLQTQTISCSTPS